MCRRDQGRGPSPLSSRKVPQKTRTGGVTGRFGAGPSPDEVHVKGAAANGRLMGSLKYYGGLTRRRAVASASRLRRAFSVAPLWVSEPELIRLQSDQGRPLVLLCVCVC